MLIWHANVTSVSCASHYCNFIPVVRGMWFIVQSHESRGSWCGHNLQTNRAAGSWNCLSGLFCPDCLGFLSPQPANECNSHLLYLYYELCMWAPVFRHDWCGVWRLFVSYFEIQALIHTFFFDRLYSSSIHTMCISSKNFLLFVSIIY